MRKIFTCLGALAAVVLIALLSTPVAVGAVTHASYTIITNTDVSKIWRKSQGKLAPGFNFVTPEFQWISDFKELDIDTSLREMTFPVDIYEDTGIASIPEGGKEAQPSSKNAEDATISLIYLNGRFNIAKQAKWGGMADGGRGAIEKQLLFQGRKKVKAMGRNLGDQFYGFSTGYFAQASATQGGAASHTITLINGYASTLVPATSNTQKAYIANLFKVGDQVALIQGGALVANAIGTVTAVSPTTPSISVTWVTGTPAVTQNDFIVLANSSGQTTIAHTNYNRHLPGLLDAITSTSLHGLSGSSVLNWTAAVNDSTTGGRFNGIKWRKAVDEIQNYGDADSAPVTLFSQGVYRDTMAQYITQNKFEDTFSLEIDGDITARGKKPKISRRVPPGMVMLFDPKYIRRKTIYDTVDESQVSWGNAKELIDDAAYMFTIDWAGLIAYQNRKTLALYAGLTES